MLAHIDWVVCLGGKRASSQCYRPEWQYNRVCYKSWKKLKKERLILEYFGQQRVMQSGEARRGVKEQVSGGAVQLVKRYKGTLEWVTGNRHNLVPMEQSEYNSTRPGWVRLGTSVGAKPDFLIQTWPRLFTQQEETGVRGCAWLC